jgi:hypothetical protein
MSRLFVRQLVRVVAVAMLACLLVRLLATAGDTSRGNSAKFRPKRELPGLVDFGVLNGNLSEVDPNGDGPGKLVNRVLTPEPSEFAFRASVVRGCYLRDLLKRVHPQYQIYATQDLLNSGWGSLDLEPDPPIAVIAPYLRNLGGVDGLPLAKQQYRIQFRAGEYFAQSWSQMFDYHGGPATFSFYRQICAPREGVIGETLSDWFSTDALADTTRSQ